MASELGYFQKLSFKYKNSINPSSNLRGILKIFDAKVPGVFMLTSPSPLLLKSYSDTGCYRPVSMRWLAWFSLEMLL